jgi:hypothetical protein
MMKAMLATVTVLCLLSSAWSQPADDPDLPRWAPLSVPIFLLVANPVVQDELRLSVKQRTDIAALVKDANEIYRGWSKLDWTIRDQKTIAVQNLTNLRLAKILMGQQLERLEQIDRQRQGPGIIIHDDRASASLKLSPDQRQKLHVLAERTRSADEGLSLQLLGLNPTNRLERGKAADKLIKLYADGNVKVEAELTEEQKKVWRSVRGKPFDLRFLIQRRPTLVD